MIIVLLLFFKSICLYCQRLVLHIHDRWINPKNVRLLKEAAEAKGAKFHLDDYRQTKKSKKRRYTAATTSNTTAPSNNSATTPSTRASSVLSSLGNRAESCRFCANTPQGYCRHHFHLQELRVHKQQQSIWCPLGGGFLNRNVEYKQLRKIKRELKRTLQQQQREHQPTKSTVTGTYQSVPIPSPTLYEVNIDNSPPNSYQDSGYQSVSLSNSNSSQLSGQDSESNQLSTQEFVDLPTPISVVETTYSFESCSETPPRSTSPVLPRDTSQHSFVSCDASSTISTSYL